MRIPILTLKDLEQIGNDRKSLLFLIVMPIVFTFFMGIAYGGAGSPTTADTRLRLAGWLTARRPRWRSACSSGWPARRQSTRSA